LLDKGVGPAVRQAPSRRQVGAKRAVRLMLRILKQIKRTNFSVKRVSSDNQ
jgi:hypothetical protein